jgi:hypothetical protein
VGQKHGSGPQWKEKRLFCLLAAVAAAAAAVLKAMRKPAKLTWAKNSKLAQGLYFFFGILSFFSTHNILYYIFSFSFRLRESCGRELNEINLLSDNDN